MGSQKEATIPYRRSHQPEALHIVFVEYGTIIHPTFRYSTVQPSNCPIVQLKSKSCGALDQWVEFRAVVQKYDLLLIQMDKTADIGWFSS